MHVSLHPLRRPGSRRSIAIASSIAVLVPLAVGVPLAVSAQADSPAPACPWMDTSKTADQRADLLLTASTLGQKLRWLDEQAANNPTQTTFNGVTYPVQVDCTPKVVYTDGPDYVRGSAGVTIFPDQIGLAATFDQQLAYDKGVAQADEAFRSGKNVILGPGVSSSRTPLAGRTPEYLGEDSLLSGTMAAATVNGIQTGNPSQPVMAVIKHYVANEQELDRQTSSSNVDGRTLREVYNLPFKILIDKSNPGGIMCSYNQINGVYGCETPVLNNLLKGDTGYQGYVVSDFGAVHSTAPSLTAGLDQELNRPRFYTPANIAAALDNGSVTMAQIDNAAFRVVRAYIANGLFDHPLPAVPSTSSSTEAHKALAAQIASESSVLLKNDGNVLPLTASAKKIAIIGPTASNTPTNGVSAGTVCQQAAGPFGGGGNACPNPVAPLDAITARAAQVGATVTFDNGADLASAAATAAAADVAIVFGYSKQGEFADRTTLNLDNNGDALIAAVAAANTTTVAILETGTATPMPWLGSVKSVVEAWYPGEQQGTAIARLLYGDDNFQGRLPMTFPKSLADTPTSTPQQYPGTFANGSTNRPAGSTEIRQVSYSEGLLVGYKWYAAKNITPLFPFGFGLSYTGFAYDNLKLTANASSNGKNPINVQFRVTNTGTTLGTETAQVYLTLPSTTGEPKRLVGFAKVTPTVGGTQQVNVKIDPKAADLPMSYYDTGTHAWKIAPGTYTVEVGPSAAAVALTGTFTVG